MIIITQEEEVRGKRGEFVVTGARMDEGWRGRVGEGREARVAGTVGVRRPRETEGKS